MRKLVKGIAEFRRKVLPDYRETFARLALGQAPDALFIACSDSRVAPNVFASTDPGDLFVVRNVGNLIPPSRGDGHSTADESEAAAIEFAVMNLNITDIIVCGHSECGAMHALVEGREKVAHPNLRAWLRHGEPSLARLDPRTAYDLSPVNQLSQLNVLQQLGNLKTYPVVRDRLADGRLKLHGWWFKLSTADVFAYDESAGIFVLIDEGEAARILDRLPEDRPKPR
jgi:carbonic anhydrase